MENNSQFPVLVERRLKLKSSSVGPDLDVIIKIGFPHVVGPGEDAACPVAIEGIFGRMADIHGLDRFDALRLAITFVDSVLRTKSNEENLFWPNGEKYFSGEEEKPETDQKPGTDHG